MDLFDSVKKRLSEEKPMAKVGDLVKKLPDHMNTEAAKMLADQVRQGTIMDTVLRKVKPVEVSDEEDQYLVAFSRGEAVTTALHQGEPLYVREGRDVFDHDSDGWYFMCNSMRPGYPSWINGSVAEVGKKYHLINDDLVVLQDMDTEKTQMYLYNILNQKETGWNCIHGEAYREESFLENLFGEDEDGKTVCRDREEKPVYLFRKRAGEAELLPFQCLTVDERHVVTDGARMYYQNELTEEEKEILALRAHTLQDGENMRIRIRERVEKNLGQESRKLLQDIDVSIEKGEMVLVLGGAGAGKSTFFDAVVGTQKADAEIRIGEWDVYRDKKRMQSLIGVVPQDDKKILWENDTVYMTLRDAANKGLPHNVKADPRLTELRIRRVLEMLDMEKEADNLVNKLSGGQKKKLNVAMKFIIDPAVFLLDEPDSGLDDPMASSLLLRLRDSADRGKIVLVISHVPDRIPDLYDKVIVLAKDSVENCGTLSFAGTPKEAMEFFGTESLRGIVTRVQEEPDHYIDKYKKQRAAETAGVMAGDNQGHLEE